MEKMLAEQQEFYEKAYADDPEPDEKNKGQQVRVPAALLFRTGE